jgi:hypothetical protein
MVRLVAPVTLCLVSTTAGLKWLPEHAREGLFAKNHPELLPPQPSEASKGFTLELPLDHFDANSPSFKDHYFTDDSYFDANSGPIFVEMGGEGGVGGARAGSLHKKYKALAVSVEHRFYGKSMPQSANPRTVDNLKYLTVQQNLADTAAIANHVKKQYAGTHTIINFGGSYSGATAAWFRMTYPNVTSGAISSSGVVNAILNFTDFDVQIAEAIDKPVPGCADLLRKSTKAMEASFAASENEKSRVKKELGASNLIGTKMGDSDFWYMVADGTAMADQYGSKAELCNHLKKLPATATDAERITNIATFLTSFWGKDFGSKCFYDSECLKTENGGSMDRSWRWQKCTQLAYLQPGYTNSLRSEQLTLQDEIDQCTYVFGKDAIPADLGTAKFNEEFGGAVPGSGTLQASKIHFSDYSDDPWNRASVSKQISADLPYCFLECDGCGHCGAGVPRNLTKCSDEEDAYVAKWLSEADDEDL